MLTVSTFVDAGREGTIERTTKEGSEVCPHFGMQDSDYKGAGKSRQLSHPSASASVPSGSSPGTQYRKYQKTLLMSSPGKISQQWVNVERKENK